MAFDNNDYSEQVELDLTGETTTGLLPEGDYYFRLDSFEKYTSNAGNPTLRWELTAFDKKDPSLRKGLRHFTSLKPDALWKVTETVEAFGLGKAGQKVNLGASALGSYCLGRVNHGEYNGEPREEVGKLWACDQEKAKTLLEGAQDGDVPF